MHEFKDSRSEPLPQKVEYDLDDHLIYGNQKGWKKVIEWIVTVIAWLFILTYIVYLVYGCFAVEYGWYLPEFFFYSRDMIFEIRKYFVILFIAAVIFVVLLLFWKIYNKRRFGRLHRRKFRPDVTNEEIAEQFELDPLLVGKMQSERYIRFDKNIIPEELGMGGGKSKKETKKDAEREAEKEKQTV